MRRKVIIALLLLLSTFSVLLTSQLVLDGTENGGAQEANSYKYHIAMVTQNGDSLLWQNVFRAALEEGKRQDVLVERIGDTLAEQISAEQAMEMAIYAQVDGILVQGEDSASMIALIGEGNLCVQLEEPRTRDEVGTVTRAFNGMVGRLNENIRRTRESLEEQLRMKENELEMERLLREARLQYYQAQIDPHYRFNTLNARQQLAMMEGAERTYDFMDNLACFCRYRLRRSGETATLREHLRADVQHGDRCEDQVSGRRG